MKLCVKAILSLLLFTTVLISAESAPAPSPTPPAANKVDGLEIPASQTVSFDEGFVTLKATCAGPVQWIVIGSYPKIKTRIDIATKEICISIPPVESDISVFCVGVVSGNPTLPARTDILIKGPAPPVPTPSPNPNPTPPTPGPIAGKLHFTIIEDPNQRTEQQAKLFTSQTLRSNLQNVQVDFHLLSVNDPVIDRKNFRNTIRGKQLPYVIIQTTTGKLVYSDPLPQTEQDILNLISQLRGAK